MKEYGRIFRADMVLAILADRKNQTRRFDAPWEVGDRIWVRETFAYWPMAGTDGEAGIVYRANRKVTDEQLHSIGRKWKSSIFMHRFESRITLEVLAKRQERLQEISEEDSIAEGISIIHPFCGSNMSFDIMYDCGDDFLYHTARESYSALWDSINGKKPSRAWADNPLIQVTTFKRV